MPHRFLYSVLLRASLMAAIVVSSAPVWASRPFRGGAVATAYAPSTEAAQLMLKKGGSAVDAAVAAAFVDGVAGPYHNGIGGGGFALVYDAKEKKTRVLDFRETAPAGASRDMFLRDGNPVPELSQQGSLSIATPGAVKGYLTLLAKWGKLPRSVVMAPAIALARDGIWVSPKYRAMATPRVSCLAKDPEAAKLFLRPNEKGELDVPAIGTVLKNPDLARTLQRIAAQGESAFYSGDNAKAIAKSVHDAGGVLTQQDLTDYQLHWREPLEGTYRGHHIATMPPPSAGGLVLLEVLGQMEALQPKGYARADPDAVHTYVEAVRRSYVDRAKFLGDPGFVKVPLDTLNTAGHFAELAKSIDPKHATDSHTLLPGLADVKIPVPGKAVDAGSIKEPPPHNTTHLSVIDKDGNAVALTTTINGAFGSCIVAKGTGVLLNNEMDDFSAKPMTPNAYGLVSTEVNSVQPKKIPLSSMTPTLVFQKERPDEVMLAVGSPGGSTIPTTVVQVLMNVVDHGMDLQRAVAAGRVHHQYLPDVVILEKNGLEPATVKALEQRGHKFKVIEALGDAEAVYVDPVTHLHYASSDPRNEGLALGQE